MISWFRLDVEIRYNIVELFRRKFSENLDFRFMCSCILLMKFKFIVYSGFLVNIYRFRERNFILFSR